MSVNNSIISVMFEEIKSLLKSIDKKLNERLTINENPSSQETATEPKSDVQTNMVIPEQMLRLIATYMQNSDQKIGNISDTVSESEKHVLSHIEDIKRITISQKSDSKIRHYHIVDLRSSKVVITDYNCLPFGFASDFIIRECSTVYSKLQDTDNNLKYSYIKSANGVSSENLFKLEDIFHYNRGKKLNSEIRQKVEEYEMKLNKAAEKFERQKRQKDTKVMQ